MLMLIACRAVTASLTDEDRKMLQDAGGWEYVSLSLSDSQNGFPTKHTCFDGKDHPELCSGNLNLSPSGRFAQTTRIKGQNVERKGRYELSGDQVAFFDEFGTKDGPYTLTLDKTAKTLKMQQPQLTVELLLQSEYRERRKASKPKPPPVAPFK